MKFPLLFTALVLCYSATHAQKEKDIPAFGKIDPSETALTECAFDKNAGAVVLFDVGKFTTNFNGSNIFSATERHVRIKILTDKGLDEADIKIPYRSYKGEEDVKNLVAQTYNVGPDGKIVVSKVEKAVIYNKKINSRYSQDVFTFPDVKAGSIIEYKYTIKGSWIQDWTFQRSIPVMLSRYMLEFPTELDIVSHQFGGYQVETKQSLKGSSNYHTHTVRNLPGFRDEPYITTASDYVQRMQSTITAITVNGIRRSLLPTWPSVIKGLMEDEDFGVQLKRNIPRTADLDAALKGVDAPFVRMKLIHDYVRKNMEWNGYSSLWALDGVKSAWKDKKGTSGEINLILVNLLKDAGLNAQPVLVSTRSNGRVSTSVPDINQFDKVLAHVRINDKVYVLDGTDKYTPSDLIPLDVMLTEGLVIGKLSSDDWGWEVLWDDKHKFNNLTIFSAEMKTDGTIAGAAKITSLGYARSATLPNLKQGTEKFVTQYLETPNPGFKFENFVLKNETVDSLPLIQEFKYSYAANEAGNYRYFSANLFSGLEKNPFISEERFSDVFFGANQQYSIVGTITIPKGYVVEQLPKNTRMIMPDTSISVSRLNSITNNVLSTRIVLEFKRPLYSPDEYGYFMEFYKKLIALINEQYVVRKEEGVANN
ncbi:MAG: DUF3857 domain-containing protein [Chitinophagaceae bacterium]|nr:MAG: DUF3857 domain-containing protein [Chitinophagaceae bacterium]